MKSDPEDTDISAVPTADAVNGYPVVSAVFPGRASIELPKPTASKFRNRRESETEESRPRSPASNRRDSGNSGVTPRPSPERDSGNCGVKSALESVVGSVVESVVGSVVESVVGSVVESVVGSVVESVVGSVVESAVALLVGPDECPVSGETAETTGSRMCGGWRRTEGEEYRPESDDRTTGRAELDRPGRTGPTGQNWANR